MARLDTIYIEFASLYDCQSFRKWNSNTVYLVKINEKKISPWYQIRYNGMHCSFNNIEEWFNALTPEQKEVAIWNV